MTNHYFLTLSLFAMTPLIAQNDAHSSRADMVLLDETAVQNIGVETAFAEELTFEQTVFSIGRIEEIPSRRSVLSSRVPGRVKAVYVFEGDTVEKGDLLVEVESRQPGNPPPVIELRAPQSGTVVASHIRVGEPVEPDRELMDISDRSTLWAVAQIPEQLAVEIEPGTSARIRIPVLGDTPVLAKLERFGVVADRTAGAIEGVFPIDNRSGKLRPGLRAEFSIITGSRDWVLSIPREAVQGDATQRHVFIKDFELPNAFLRSPVVLGETNDRVVEVLAGVFPGDEIVTNGSYALGFAGSASGMSLKEALDAAHGHEHNEDGTEMTPEQKATGEAEADHGHSHAHGPGIFESTLGKALSGYAAAITLLCLVLLQQLLNRRRQKTDASAEGSPQC